MVVLNVIFYINMVYCFLFTEADLELLMTDIHSFFSSKVFDMNT